MKRPNLHLTDALESDKNNGTKLENTLQDIIQENLLNLPRKANIQIQELQRTTQRYSSGRETQRYIIITFTTVEIGDEARRGGSCL